MFKDGDIVKIKLEWCDSPREHEQFHVVFNNNEEERKCCIGWIPPKGYKGLGSSQNVLWDYIEKA